MYLKYGSYAHSIGECDISISKSTEYNEAQIPWAVRERWDIQGLLLNPTGDLTTMKTNTDALEAAYGYSGYDLVLYTPANAATAHALISSQCIGGTRVVQPVSFPTGQGAEGITHRAYTISVEGLVAVGNETLMSFNESLSFSGGGPSFGHIETLTGYPVKQQLRHHTIFKVTQKGQAVGIYAYPTIPAGVWPAAQIHGPNEERSSPRKVGAEYIEYPVSWSYEFESAYPLLGNPTRWT